ncbi:hypothetical protein DT73_10980 [Mangrovibacter sp. MFB070]|nr:hypothetical protein DT73_10980 [Mangrovibacter sp. MFB070]
MVLLIVITSRGVDCVVIMMSVLRVVIRDFCFPLCRMSGHRPDRVVFGARPTGGGHKTFPPGGLKHFQVSGSGRQGEGGTGSLTAKNDNPGAKAGICASIFSQLVKQLDLLLPQPILSKTHSMEISFLLTQLAYDCLRKTRLQWRLGLYPDLADKELVLYKIFQRLAFRNENLA